MTAIHRRPDGTKHVVLVLSRIHGLPGFFHCVSNENQNEHLNIHRDFLTFLEEPTPPEQVE